jgi:hypothetical protein
MAGRPAGRPACLVGATPVAMVFVAATPVAMVLVGVTPVAMVFVGATPVAIVIAVWSGPDICSSPTG